MSALSFTGSVIHSRRSIRDGSYDRSFSRRSFVSAACSAAAPEEARGDLDIGEGGSAMRRPANSGARGFGAGGGAGGLVIIQSIVLPKS